MRVAQMAGLAGDTDLSSQRAFPNSQKPLFARQSFPSDSSLSRHLKTLLFFSGRPCGRLSYERQFFECRGRRAMLLEGLEKVICLGGRAARLCRRMVLRDTTFWESVLRGRAAGRR